MAYAQVVPPAASTNPASAGPATRAVLPDTALSAMADATWLRPTTRMTEARSAGAPRAKAQMSTAPHT